MNKKAKTALISVGAVSAAALAGFGISRIIERTLIREGLYRTPPELMTNGMGMLSGNSFTNENMEKARQKAGLMLELDTKPAELTSFDGVRLVGRVYESEAPKRIIIAMHGWRSSWNIDFSGIYNFWHDNGSTVLYPDQRAQGESEGEYMGFGLLERRDCVEWAKWAVENISDTLPIYLAGISMGATTVLMASGDPDLPENVHGIMADCGFTSMNEQWRYVMDNNLHLRYSLHEKRVKKICSELLGQPIDGYSTLDAMAANKTPVLFFHGTDDHFVPVEMTYENFNACKAPKMLMLADGADHAVSYLADKERYQRMVLEFWEKYDEKTEENVI